MAHVDEGEDDDCGVSLGSKILELKKKIFDSVLLF